MIVQTNNFHNAEVGENDALIFRYEKVTKTNGEDATKRYIQGRLLGFGSFAKVYQFTCPATRETFAAKMIPKSFLKDEFNHQKVKAEIKLHKSLDHPNIVKFHRSFEDDENLYILLELCPNESLSNLLKRKKKFAEPEAKEYIHQIVLALKYLHENKVLHRDLKLANLLLNSKMQLKMADFGLAAKLSSNFEKRKTSCGTPNYMAPEVMEPDRSYSYPADIWSFGVICYNMLTGRLPFEGTTARDVYLKVREGKFTFPPAMSISPEARDFINKILVLEPEKRLTLAQIQAHAFLSTSTKGETSPKVTIPIAALENFSSASRQSNESDKSPKLSTLFQKVDAVMTPENKMTRHKSASPSKVLAKALSSLQLTKQSSPSKQTRKPMIPHFPSDTGLSNSRGSPTHKRLTRQNTAQIRIFLQAEQDQEDTQFGKGDASPSSKVPEYIRSSEARFVYPEKKDRISLKSPTGTPKYITRDLLQSPKIMKKPEQKSILDSRKGSRIFEKGLIDSKNGSRIIEREKSMIDLKNSRIIERAPEKSPERSPERSPEISPAKVPEKEASTIASPPPEWSDVKVLHWTEGTETCLMGYLLSDGCVGILFSDDTKMQLSQKGDYFYYIVKGLGGKETFTKYGTHQFPGALREKVIEMQKMNRNFQKQGHKVIEQESGAEVVYVKKWLKTKHGTFFKLSNQELQVVLIDKSSLFLNAEEKKVKYIDQKGEVNVYIIGSESLNFAKEVKKRLLYTMEVLEKIWKKSSDE